MPVESHRIGVDRGLGGGEHGYAEVEGIGEGDPLAGPKPVISGQLHALDLKLVHALARPEDHPEE